jgi:hypothetical protein
MKDVENPMENPRSTDGLLEKSAINGGFLSLPGLMTGW